MRQRRKCGYVNITQEYTCKGFPGGSDGKEPDCSSGDPGLIPGLGRSPGEGNGNPLQFSCLENPMGRGAWQARVHGGKKSWTWLSHLTLYLVRNSLEKCRFDIWKELGILVTKCAICWVGQKGHSIEVTEKHKWTFWSTQYFFLKCPLSYFYNCILFFIIYTLICVWCKSPFPLRSSLHLSFMSYHILPYIICRIWTTNWNLSIGYLISYLIILSLLLRRMTAF